MGAQFSARLHLENYSPLRGAKVEITAIASRTKGRAEELARKYNTAQELADFADSLLTGREPVSGLDLAVETVKAIYAAYLSAEQGNRVELDKNII